MRKPPAYEYRLGRIKAVVWENQHPEQGVWFSTQIVRTYKDERSGQWKSAHSLGRDDLLVAAECLRMAYIWIATQASTGGGHTPQSDKASAQATSSGDEIPI